MVIDEARAFAAARDAWRAVAACGPHPSKPILFSTPTHPYPLGRLEAASCRDDMDEHSTPGPQTLKRGGSTREGGRRVEAQGIRAVSVEYDPAEVTVGQIQQVMDDLGYETRVVS